MGRPEGRVEDFLRDTFKLAGWHVHKLLWGGGAYDRLLISPLAFHLYVELKRPGKDTLDPAQVKWGINMAARMRAGNRSDHMAFEFVNSREHVRALYAKYRDC